MLEWLLRLVGYLSLFAAVCYLVYLFLPVEEGGLRSRIDAWVEGLFSGDFKPFASFAAPRARIEQRTPAEQGAAMALVEGYDADHAARIAATARLLGEAAGLDAEALEALVEAAHLHDVGEEDFAEILSKPGPLSVEERDRLGAHPLIGEAIARTQAHQPDAAWWVRWHHERFDGTGYPDGLVGDEIPLPARILAVADAFEAITHARPYRQALDPQDALTELRNLAGLHYDPHLIALFTDKVFPALVEPRKAEDLGVH
ncbi:HD domain-containing protein [bacterium]|nr:HD domain-containing protein [bacterium]